MSKLIIANWKMNGTKTKISEDLVSYINNPNTNKPNISLALPTIYLSQAYSIIHDKKAKLNLTSQDISKFTPYGAYTGEISGEMLKETKVNYAIVGHSERRMFLHENNHTLIKKLDATIMGQITPIFCIGEEKSARSSNKHISFLTQQLELLHQVEVPITKLVIAYEPIWAIGTSITPTCEEISEIMELISAFVQNYLPHAKITALYGGSVNSANAAEILKIDNLGGVLVGGASLKVEEFAQICQHS